MILPDDLTHAEPPPDCDEHQWIDTATGIACTACGVAYAAGEEPFRPNDEG